VIGRVSIKLADSEGAVSRVIGLVERRGFRLRALAMPAGGGAGALELDIEARDEGRRFDVLALQLGRLSEVRAVSFQHTPGKVSS
jgi:acetolactate synthase-1/3 small subunit/acetolactate synthase II small subunit